MNLHDLVQRVYSVTDRNPRTTSYKNEVIGYLNDRAQALYVEAEWIFLEERTTLTVYPDYDTGTVTVTNGSYLVTASNTAFWFSDMNGHQFIGPDDETYTIAYVDTVSVPNRLYLTTPYAGTGVAGADYTIRFFAYPMPDDCVDPGPITSREDDRGRISYIDNETEAQHYLDRDDTGDPYVYLNAGAWHTRTLDTEPTAKATVGGTLTASASYTYCVTVFYEGVESAPSKQVSATTTAANKTIELENIQDFTAGALPTGYRKRVYRRTSEGAFYFLAELDWNDTTYTDDGSDSIDLSRPLKDFGEAYKVWFYPRPDEEQEVEVWYKRRPRRMYKDQDVPDLPPEFHDILWRQAAIDVLEKYNQPTSTQERIVEERMKALKRRYLNRSDRRWAMQSSWGDSAMARWRFRNGSANLT
jgi:hypothetical protein